MCAADRPKPQSGACSGARRLPDVVRRWRSSGWPARASALASGLPLDAGPCSRALLMEAGVVGGAVVPPPPPPALAPRPALLVPAAGCLPLQSSGSASADTILEPLQPRKQCTSAHSTHRGQAVTQPRASSANVV